MILVKKRHLYILVTLVCILLVFGEVRFFRALKSVNLAVNMEVKYEMESFIFNSIVLTLAVYLFLVYFMRKSSNVLKRLDKMIELSEYGKYDISGHLQKLGRLGKKIEYLLYHFRELSDMKTLKISSLSGINDLLIRNNEQPLFLLNRHGNVVNCSDPFLTLFRAKKDAIMKRNINELFKDVNYEEFFFELEKARDHVIKEDVTIEINGSRHQYKVDFYSIVNAKGDISHIVGVLEV